jgi:isoquinoline 1-oxidoreductase beta subunit
MLAAAEKWNVPISELHTEPSVVIHAPSGRRMGYGEIASLTKLPIQLPTVTPEELKKPSAFRLIGTSQPRRVFPEKVNGTARFAMDVRLPGMAYATVVHAPIQGAKPESYNEAEVKAIKGIIATVGLPLGIALVGESFESVLAARARLNPTWSSAKAGGFDSDRALTGAYPRLASDPATRTKDIGKVGDNVAGFVSATRRIRAEYFADYGYHAQMEPLNAVARFNDAGNRVEIWDGTQSPDDGRKLVAKALGFGLEQVVYNQMYMGGGFGRRDLADYTVEAALTARAVKRPVKMIWTREEDIAFGMFRPQSFQFVEAGLDADNNVVAWTHCSVGDGGRLQTSGMRLRDLYRLPNQHQFNKPTNDGVRVKDWRATGRAFNIYAIEETVDRLAAAAGMDPMDFRLEKMRPTARTKRALMKVAEMCDWKRQRPGGRAVGVSVSQRSASIAAAAVEISLEGTSGKIRVHRVWFAMEGGVIVHPDAARANIESGIVQGISSALYERISVVDGMVQQSNFHDYHVMRMSDVPETIQVEFIDPMKGAPSGLGEIGNPPVPPAIAAAFYRLTSKRLTHMPFTPERVLAALSV